jgi:ABC-type transport system substrate-binding protein
LLQNGAKKVGIEIKIESAPWPVVQSRMQDREKNYDMVPLWKSTYYVDPNNWVGELYGSRYIGTRNSSYVKDPELDKWIDEALATNDQEKRRVLYEKAATKVTEQAMGIFVYNTKWYGPYAANIGGIRFSPIGSGQDMRWAYYK